MVTVMKELLFLLLFLISACGMHGRLSNSFRSQESSTSQLTQPEAGKDSGASTDKSLQEKTTQGQQSDLLGTVIGVSVTKKNAHLLKSWRNIEHVNLVEFSEEDESILGTAIIRLESGIRLFIDSPGEYKFLDSSSIDGKVWHIERDGTKTLYAVKIGISGLPGKNIVNPLDGISPKEASSLTGIYLEEWSTEIALQMENLPLDHMAICIEIDKVSSQTDGIFPYLPDRARFLFLERASEKFSTPWNSSKFFDYSNLQSLDSLLLFSISGSGETFNFEWLSSNLMTRYISTHGSNICGLSWLTVFLNLRVLEITNTDDLYGFDFLNELESLYHLDFSNTNLIQLPNISNLVQIRTIDVSNTDISSLSFISDNASKDGNIPPTDIKTNTNRYRYLHRLNALKTLVTAEQATAFKKSFPSVSLGVDFEWELGLKNAITRADRVTVSDYRDFSVSFTIDEEKEIQKLIELISIDSEKSGYEISHPFCGGNVQYFQFYQDGEEIERVTFHYSSELLWSGWNQTGLLTEKSQDRMASWLFEHGITEPFYRLKERRNREALQKKALRF